MALFLRQNLCVENYAKKWLSDAKISFIGLAPDFCSSDQLLL
jgi:hypothetical protein